MLLLLLLLLLEGGARAKQKGRWLLHRDRKKKKENQKMTSLFFQLGSSTGEEGDEETGEGKPGPVWGAAGAAVWLVLCVAVRVRGSCRSVCSGAGVCPPSSFSWANAICSAKFSARIFLNLSLKASARLSKASKTAAALSSCSFSCL